ncbi:hypothetical protein [Streptomyces sp. NPDC059894]|uniref:hypothetical protein n=1 Tax=unclassified Streptomyces TaxID=2593676 RepID=UPI00365DB788
MGIGEPAERTVTALEREHGHLTQRIDCPLRNRDAVADHPETVRALRAAADTPGHGRAA